jgi:hypothetical protein
MKHRTDEKREQDIDMDKTTKEQIVKIVLEGIIPDCPLSIEAGLREMYNRAYDVGCETGYANCRDMWHERLDCTIEDFKDT